MQINPLTYLPKEYHGGFILSLISFYIFSFWSFLGIGLFLYILSCWAFRRSNVGIKNLLSFSNNFDRQFSVPGGVIAPVNGQILKIFNDIKMKGFEKKFNCVQIAVPWWEEYGIFLPVSSEVTKVQYDNSGKAHPRWKKFNIEDLENRSQIPKLSIEFSGPQNNPYILEFIHCPLGGSTKTILTPGDIGKGGANFGHQTLGGSVLLYLPQNYKIVAKAGESVNPNRGIIATI